ECRMYDADAERLRKVHDDREPRRLFRRSTLRADLLDRLLNCHRSGSDVGFGRLRARDGEHQRRGVAEVSNEVYWTCAIGKIVDRIESECYVVELLAALALARFLIELQIDNRYAGPRDRFDLGHHSVGCHLLFNLLGYQLLDLLS